VVDFPQEPEEESDGHPQISQSCRIGGPLLLERQGEQMTGVGEVRPTMGTPGGLMPSPWTFRKHGQCGMEISELFPHVAEHADDLALIRSMYAPRGREREVNL
jgi:hypothetical protein